MSASNPLINSPHAGGMARHPDHHYITRPKRSDSAQFDHPSHRGHFDAANRMLDVSEEPTFIPTSLGEHLLERTYLDDVVRPLVRALVKARMTYEVNGDGAAESSQAYVDLEKLRRELERSTQRARHAEQERDDLARRLDLVGGPDAASRDRADYRSQQPFPPPPAASGMKRPRASEYDRRSPAAPVIVAHGDGGPGASIPLTNEPPHNAPVSMVSRAPHLPPGSEQISPPPMSYAHLGAPRHRPYAEMQHGDPHETDQRHLARMPHNNAALEAEYGYADERVDRYGMPLAGPLHRPPVSRFGGMGGVRSPPPSGGAYLNSSSERSSMPALTNFPSASSSGSYGAPYASGHPYEQHEVDEMERSRKIAPMRPGEPPMEYVPHSMGGGGGGGRPLSGNYSATEAGNYPVRKLASTKNRTCSNCSAPHDAKFRRGPNGPGTLCDRCGSRWKKYKEQESVSRRDSQQSHEAGFVVPLTSSASASAVGAAATAQARLSSASASSRSPMDPSAESGVTGGEEGTGNARHDAGSAVASPRDVGTGAGSSAESVQPQRERERERSASVDQLIDD
ncbi:hypothetical protein EX895_002876 [Sporisorium graminicola]|uniref:GATA-type domain-containing protein n=1 Tax=Sporisorium graminicola TaxID=280036 RepID=A0A4U7KVG1_9BASI|nr:hypothetical protein EX895_002876 [Sporisorium graminicola]TKY88166.1 hypothetical protein EX895_002876 [Sporisorium graminicola]